MFTRWTGLISQLVESPGEVYQFKGDSPQSNNKYTKAKIAFLSMQAIVYNPFKCSCLCVKKACKNETISMSPNILCQVQCLCGENTQTV